MLIDHRNIPATVLTLLNRLTVDPSIDRIMLFGSRACGDFEPRSDVDIAIFSESMSDLNWARLRSAMLHGRTLYGLTLVRFERLPKALQARIMETGEVLYVAAEASGQLEQFGTRSEQS